jgi:arginine deiminase
MSAENGIILPPSVDRNGTNFREFTGNGHELGIHDENHRLTRAAIWGPIGAEALVAQLLPTNISLFLSSMNVIKARKEIEQFQLTLESHGVAVTPVRDEYARQLPSDTHLVLKEVRDAILDKKNEITKRYHTEAPGHFEDDLDFLLDSDIHSYGLQKALALNVELILEPDIPMGNLLYARDQMNVILGHRVQSRMKHPIRVPEIEIYETVYRKMNLPEPIVLPNDPRYTFEGGDAYVHDGVIYVGVGPRTTAEAARYIYQELRLEIIDKGYAFVMVKDTTGDQGQDFMHLDTFSNPVGENEMVVCKAGAERREVVQLCPDTSGDIKEINRGPFIDYLQRYNEVYDVPADAQKEFACNFLARDGYTIFAADTNSDANKAVSDFLAGKIQVPNYRQPKKNVLPVPLEECTKGFGAAHCMTGQLVRRQYE